MIPVQNILKNYAFVKWINYVENFMIRYDLWPKGEAAWVALSGGRDSTLLLFTMYSLFKRGRLKHLKLLHFNHRTRSACQMEENLVVQYSELLQLTLVKGHPPLPQGRSNIEHVARKERYAFFKRTIELGDRVYLGHHLDDSLEWSLMARFKSSRLESQLGIPVVNGAFARPFLGVTRKQISKMAKNLNLDWSEDESNQNIRFERNFLRIRTIPSIGERFPGYLRHYATSSNELARQLGVYRGRRGGPFRQKRLPLGGVGLFHPHLESNFLGAEGLIRKIVEQLSSGDRGSLASQIDKMIQAAARGRQGPIFFSGSVRGYMAPGVLFFIRSDGLEVWRRYDRAITRFLKQKRSLKSIPLQGMGRQDLVDHISSMPFPPIGVGGIEGRWNPEKRDFLLPRTSSLFRDRGWQLKSLVKMAKKMNKKGEKSQVLPLDLLARMGDFCCIENTPKATIEEGP